MLNAALPASNNVYGKKKCFSWYSKFTSPKTERHRGAVVKELLALADKQGSTSGKAVFLFFIIQFFLYLILFFTFGLFLFILTSKLKLKLMSAV